MDASVLVPSCGSGAVGGDVGATGCPAGEGAVLVPSGGADCASATDGTKSKMAERGRLVERIMEEGSGEGIRHSMEHNAPLALALPLLRAPVNRPAHDR